MKRHVLHVGDWVQVRTPDFVERVGYPKTVRDYYNVVESGAELKAVIRRIHPKNTHWEDPGCWTPALHKAYRELVHRVAHVAAKRDGFGGKVRQIHRYSVATAVGKITQVLAKKTVVTGTYSSGYSSYTNVEDSEPACLENQQRHLLIQLNLYLPDVAAIGTKEYWIEASNLVKAEEPPPSLPF